MFPDVPCKATFACHDVDIGNARPIKQHPYRLNPGKIGKKYSRSQNNVNVVYCNYKETNSSYNVIAKRSSPQTLLIVGNIFKIFV